MKSARCALISPNSSGKLKMRSFASLFRSAARASRLRSWTRSTSSSNSARNILPRLGLVELRPNVAPQGCAALALLQVAEELDEARDEVASS
jgi:hypothetical protein